MVSKLAKRKATSSEPIETSPCLDPEAREAQLISLAVDLAEQRLIAGTASSQEIVHFLRLGTQKEALEREKLRQENDLLRAKTGAIKSQEEREKQYAAAIAAMMRYGGHSDE